MAVDLRLLSLVGITCAIGVPAYVAYCAPAHAAPTQGKLVDGTYTGQTANAYYGNIQVQVVVQNGAIVGFRLLSYPSHTGTSIEINRQALPILAQEVVAAQNTQVDFVSGATLSSEAFLRSVASALPK